MRIVEINQEQELQELRPAWDALLRTSASKTIFLTWEWMSVWWAAYGVPGELRILTAWDDGGALRGIAPLRRQFVRRYGRAVPALSFIGDGSNDSDYLDFIIAAGCEAPVMEAFRAALANEIGQGTVLLLNEIPDTSPNLPLLRTIGESRELIWNEQEVACAVVRLPATWDAYLGSLRPRFRTKVRSVLRNLEGRPEAGFSFCVDRQQAERLLPVLYDLHTRRWAEENKPGVFGWEAKRRFYALLSPLLLDRGWLRFGWLEWSGKVLACSYGFSYNGSYLQLQEGYEPAAEHWSVGAGLRAWSIRHFVSEGLSDYDFLGGIGRHKSDWGAETKFSQRIMLCRKTASNVVFCRAPQWEEQARQTIKKMVPQRVLTVRQSRLERRRADAFQSFQNEHAVAGTPWFRSAVAECYFHSRLPALVRPLREHYRLLIAEQTNGNHTGAAKWPRQWPKISWNKRTAPCARILYYHRVNDEGDPFFPAISTALFEQEMRHVVRHYQVVSLAEMMRRLDGSSPQPVVAITFDDGYQDNFENAFPILQRYSLPATIFLTTGAMDSGRPLWFEQLALAFKKTAGEYLDLELDFPRRFWLRTASERLLANGEVFSILRRLPDPERRAWLAEILTLLAVPDGGERNNKMLTWERVRQMKQQGIDFGGHTVDHPFLSRMPAEEAIWQVSECKRRIEEELQQPADYFAYPNGREEDFGQRNKALIRQAGYKAAMTTIWGMNYQSTDRMELRRGGPWEKSQAVFAYKLDWYQLMDD